MIRWPETPPVLHVGDLTLRPWEAADAPDVLAACQDPEIQRWTTVPTPYLPEHAEGFVGGVTAAGWLRRTSANFAVVTPDGRLAAANGLVRVDLVNRAAEIGYWVAPWARRRGVATTSTVAIAIWAFGLGFARVELRAAAPNVGSRAVAIAAGFREEGVLRSAVERAGIRHDLVVHGLLDTD